MANPRNLANIAPAMNGSSGNVGIGTASPSAKLDVNTTGSAGVFTTTQTSGNAVTINVDGSSGTPVGLRVAAGFGTIGSTAKLINVVDSAGGNLFNAQASGVIGVGSGITFPATQVASSNANTLDDYEEGTWTPTIAFGGGSTGITYQGQSGIYTKIGNRVFITCYVQMLNKGSSTGILNIVGLPFTTPSATSSNEDYRASGTIYTQQLTASYGYLQFITNASTNTIFFGLQADAGGNPSAIDNTNCSNETAFRITVNYNTTS